MQKLSFALVALFSLLILNARPTQAQDTGKAVEPTSRPQEINERASSDMRPDNGTPAIASDRPATQFLLKRGETTEGSLTVQNETVTIEGTVKGDLTARNSTVTIVPGGKVTGKIIAENSRVENHSGEPVQMTLKEGNSSGSSLGMAMAPPAREFSPRLARNLEKPARSEIKGEASPVKGQFNLLVMGLIAGAILLLIAPVAAPNAAATVGVEPGRCMVVGIFGATMMAFGLTINAVLTYSPLRLVWSPFGFLVGTATVLVLGYGWLCGMRFAGDLLAKRFGRTPGSFYGRMALGLTACFVATIVLNGLGLGIVGVAAQFLLSLMGLGAVIITGFGTETNWLGPRLRNEASWLSFGRK